MQLDNTQPWMRNRTIKARILLHSQPMNNPVMRAYQDEFNALQLQSDATRKEELLRAIHRAHGDWQESLRQRQPLQRVAERYNALNDAKLAYARYTGETPPYL